MSATPHDSVPENRDAETHSEVGNSGDDTDHRFQARKKLKTSVDLGLRLIQKVCHVNSQTEENNSIDTYNPSEAFSTTGSAAGEEEEDLHSVLKSSITTLQDLSFSIWKILEEMRNEVSKPLSFNDLPENG